MIVDTPVVENGPHDIDPRVISNISALRKLYIYMHQAASSSELFQWQGDQLLLHCGDGKTVLLPATPGLH